MPLEKVPRRSRHQTVGQPQYRYIDAIYAPVEIFAGERVVCVDPWRASEGEPESLQCPFRSLPSARLHRGAVESDLEPPTLQIDDEVGVMRVVHGFGKAEVVAALFAPQRPHRLCR